jgi:SAM-dependent methyltransferase
VEASTQWQLALDAAVRYEQVLVPAILGPAARALVDWASLKPGETVLDVGCGTGAATRFAAEQVGPAGRVSGIDVNAGMIAVARSLPLLDGVAIDWQVESAYSIPLSDRSQDVVLCAQTLQFLSERGKALAEMQRVLKPGGRAVLSLWCEIESSPYFQALVEAVSGRIGPETAEGLGAAFNLSNSEEIRRLVSGANFETVEITAKQLDLDLPPLPEFVPRHVQATPMAPGFNAAPERARRAVVRDVAERLAGYQTETGVRVPFRTHLVRAGK